LEPGINELSAVVSSAAGTETATNTETVEWNVPAEEAPATESAPAGPVLYAMVLAAGNYPNLKRKAEYPPVDGRAAVRFLEKLEGRTSQGLQRTLRHLTSDMHDDAFLKKFSIQVVE